MEENLHGSSTQISQSAAPELEVVQGENIGEIYKVKIDTKLGRERDNDIVILDAKVSRYHSQVSLESGQWTITDLDSANGTVVNGLAISAPASLESGDRIRIGETELVFKLASRPDAVTAPNRGIPVSSTVKPSPSSPSTAAPAPVRAAKVVRPRIAWVAGGIILLVCFAAVLVTYLATGRLAGNETAVAGEISSEASSTGQTDSRSSPPDSASGRPEDLVLAYEDDFSDSFGGWDDAFDTHTRKVYGNNRYQIEVNTSNLVAWGLANRDVADFEMEVETKLEDGDESNSYGVLFRFLDHNNFYRFDVSGDGYFLVSKFVDGEWTTLLDWTKSEAINTGGVANILKVSAFGPELTLWANGQQLATFTDDSLAHGNFGFFAGTFAEPYAWVSFDNLKLWMPEGREITLIPTATRPSEDAAVAVAPTPTPTSAAPTATATPTSVPTEEAEPELQEGGSALESPVSTPTPTDSSSRSSSPSPSPSPTSEATATPVPLPEYASRNQTLARGEERASGRIVFPVYDSERNTYDIYIADIADGSNRELIQANASQPALSVDGTEIAYRSWQPDQRGLHARTLGEESEEAWRFDSFFEAARPQFSPLDNSLIYYSRTSGREPATYRVIDGIGEVMRRDGFPIQGKSPKWSPDGQQFVYSSCLGGTCGVILSNITGASPKLLTDHPSDTNPEISPDGSTVVFMSERAGNWEIYRVDIDGENLMALTSDKASDGLPTWSPDGSKVAFLSNRDGEWAIWDMDSDGTDKRRHFLLNGTIDGIVGHDRANSFGWVEENIDWIP